LRINFLLQHQYLMEQSCGFDTSTYLQINFLLQVRLLDFNMRGGFVFSEHLSSLWIALSLLTFHSHWPLWSTRSTVLIRARYHRLKWHIWHVDCHQYYASDFRHVWHTANSTTTSSLTFILNLSGSKIERIHAAIRLLVYTLHLWSLDLIFTFSLLTEVSSCME
jgi:hypothetical protein